VFLIFLQIYKKNYYLKVIELYAASFI